MKYSVGVFLACFLTAANWYCCLSGAVEDTVNIVPGMYSKKTVSNGLNLPATNTFRPITTLTTTIDVYRLSAIFVHYQITFLNWVVFESKLLINDANAGSLVRSGYQGFKTATGFYMDNLSPGQYKFEVQYKSPEAIVMPAHWDWQTAVLQVIWAEGAHALSDGINCSSTTSTDARYTNVWGPFRDLEIDIQMPSQSVALLAAYQFSVEKPSPPNFVHMMAAGLHVDNFYQHPSTTVRGNSVFLDLRGGWAANLGYTSKSHHIGVSYHTSGVPLFFTDCIEDYKNNTNLFVMALPRFCRATTVSPKTTLQLSNTNRWAPTDLTYTFKIWEQTHAIIMYQFSGDAGNSHFVTRLSIDSVPQPHTVSKSGDTAHVGNFGLWQGILNIGDHSITVDFRSPAYTVNSVLPNLDWTQTITRDVRFNRALTIITCDD